MPIGSYLHGPGILTLGAGPTDFSAQVTAIEVEPTENVTSTDAIDVLSGEQIPAETTGDLTYALKVSFLQDLKESGIVDYSWDNAGDEVPFEYTPTTGFVTTDATVTGVVRIVPLKVGGDIKVRPISEVTWSVIGAPAFTPGV